MGVSFVVLFLVTFIFLFCHSTDGITSPLEIGVNTGNFTLVNVPDVKLKIKVRRNIRRDENGIIHELIASNNPKRVGGPDFEIEERDSDEVVNVTRPPKRKKSKKPKGQKNNNNNNPCPESSEGDGSGESDEDVVVDSSGKKPQKKKTKPGTTPKGQVFFEETFSERTWDASWTYSKVEYGGAAKKKYEKFYRIRSKRGKKGFDFGLVTSNKGFEDYAISSSFQPINSNDDNLVLQFSLQYQSEPHCESVYLRLFDCKFKAEEFTPETPYLLQIGPNICGEEKHLSVILADPVKGERFVLSDKIEGITSTDLHMYTLIITPDGNYNILANAKSVQNGTLTNVFPNYQGYTSICAVGLNIWHSVLDKFFKGQIIIDDILISSDTTYADRKRMEILDISPSTDSNSSSLNKLVMNKN